MEVPVPPLTDAESAQRFHRMLMLHVARLKHRGDPVGLHQFLLAQVLSLHLPAREGTGRCADCGQRFPCRTTLLTALLTRLPVPWTPTSLGRALSTAKLWPSASADHDVIQDGRLEYGDRQQLDPWYRAERNPQTGRWLVFTYERGSLRRSQHLDDDQQLCDFLVTQVVLLPFPYGWKTDETWGALLDPGAVSTRQWWSVHGSLPYLASYRPEGAWEPDSAG
jgi:hypothetical protein